MLRAECFNQPRMSPAAIVCELRDECDSTLQVICTQTSRTIWNWVLNCTLFIDETFPLHRTSAYCFAIKPHTKNSFKSWNAHYSFLLNLELQVVYVLLSFILCISATASSKQQTFREQSQSENTSQLFTDRAARKVLGPTSFYRMFAASLNVHCDYQPSHRKKTDLMPQIRIYKVGKCTVVCNAHVQRWRANWHVTEKEQTNYCRCMKAILKAGDGHCHLSLLEARLVHLVKSLHYIWPLHDTHLSSFAPYSMTACRRDHVSHVTAVAGNKNGKYVLQMAASSVEQGIRYVTSTHAGNCGGQ